MTYEIYSLGDARYLAQVLNAVAALGGDGTYASLVGFSLLLGILIVSIQAIVGGGQKFDLQIFVVSVVAYQVIFVPRATVIVNDVYSGQTEVVDNVPWGLAFVGSFLNQVGYAITEKMELAFTTPTMTTNGFGGAMANIMNAKRITGFGLADFGCGSEPPAASHKAFSDLSTSDRKCSLQKTIATYVESCVAPAIRNGDLQASAIYNSNNAINEMAVNYRALYTGTYIYAGAFSSGDPPTDGWSVPCGDAYAAIKTRVEKTVKSDLMDNYMKSVIGGSDPTIELGNSLQALTNAAYNAQDLMTNMAIRDAVQDGFVAYTNRNDAMLAAAMLTSGNEQRNMQWAGEATLFSRLIRPLITFFEAMMFATAPFVAFLIGLGTFGFKLAMKYLYLPIWVNMWMPVMAIVNLYVNMIAEGRMAALDTGTAGTVISIAGSAAMYSSLSDWLGTASMLASSVPAITMSLLFGGAVSMSALAGRLQSGDYTNEKLAAPDVANPAAAMNMESTATGNRLTGPQATGSNDFLPQLSLGSQLSQQVSGQQTVTDRAVASAGRELMTTMQAGAAQNLSTTQMQKVASALQNSTNDNVRAAFDQTVADVKSAGVEESKAAEVAAAIMMQASAGGGASLGADVQGGKGGSFTDRITEMLKGSAKPENGNTGPTTATAEGTYQDTTGKYGTTVRGGLAVNASANATGSTTSRDIASVANKIASRFESGDRANLSEGVGSELTKSILNEKSAQDQQQFLKNLGVTDSDSVKRSFQKASEETNQLAQVTSATASDTGTRNLSGNALATLMTDGAKAKPVMAAIDKALAGNEQLREAYQRVFESGQLSPNGNSIFLGDQNKEKAAAFMLASQDVARNPGSTQALDAVLDSRQEVLSAAGLVTGSSRPTDKAPAAMSDSDRRQVDGARTRAEGAGAGAQAAGAVPAAVDSAMGSSEALAVARNQDMVNLNQTPQEQYAQDSEKVRVAGEDAAAGMGAAKANIYADRVRQGLAADSNGVSEGFAVNQLLADSGGVVKDIVQRAASALGMGDDDGAANTLKQELAAAQATTSAALQEKGVPAATANYLAKALNENIVENQIADLGEKAARFITGSDAPTTLEQTKDAAEQAFRSDYMASRGYGDDYDKLTSEQKAEVDQFAKGTMDIALSSAAGGEAGLAGASNVVGYYVTSGNGIDKDDRRL